MGLFVFIPYLKHIDKDINGSFVYKIREYEARLLDEKIDNLERQIEIKKLEYNVLLGVNKICEIVLAKNKGCFKSIRAKKDVNMLKKLELNISLHKLCHVEKIIVDGTDVYLLYDKEKWRINKLTIKEKLINKDFVIIYEIMEKYGLLETI